MERGLWASGAVGFLLTVVLFSPLNAAHAGFLDWLFGPRKSTVQASAPAPSHVDVAIRRSRASADKKATMKVARVRAKVAPAAKPLDPKEQLARTIDPKTRPDWYLIDPTLRKGDVLFLANRVVVFKGGKIGETGDYVPVGSTRLLSKKERRMIAAMAPHPATPVVAANPAPRRVAALKTAQAD